MYQENSESIMNVTGLSGRPDNIESQIWKEDLKS